MTPRNPLEPILMGYIREYYADPDNRDRFLWKYPETVTSLDLATRGSFSRLTSWIWLGGKAL